MPEESLFARVVASAAGTKGAVIHFFQTFIKLFDSDSVAGWFIQAVRARRVVAGIALGISLGIGVIVGIRVVIKSHGRRRGAVAHVAEECRGGRAGAMDRRHWRGRGRPRGVTEGAA